MNPGCFKKMQEKASGKPYHTIANHYHGLSMKRTGTQRRANHDTCIVCTAVGEKVHLGVK